MLIEFNNDILDTKIQRKEFHLIVFQHDIDSWFDKIGTVYQIVDNLQYEEPNHYKLLEVHAFNAKLSVMLWMKFLTSQTILKIKMD